MLYIIIYGLIGAIPAMILRLMGKRYTFGKAFLISCACCLFSIILQIAIVHLQLVSAHLSYSMARGTGVTLAIAWACLIKGKEIDNEL